MDDADYDALAEAVQKLAKMQVQTLSRLTQVQALLWTVHSQLKAVQVNQGGDLPEVDKQVTEFRDSVTDALRDELKGWLADHGISTPAPDDEWWDKPPSV